MKSKLVQLYFEMESILNEEQQNRSEVNKLLGKADTILDPRQQFNNWLRSSEGQAWKKQQFEKQQGKCSHCQKRLRIEDVHVHHVIPLSSGKANANKTSNYKLLHPNCNLKIGTKLGDFND